MSRFLRSRGKDADAANCPFVPGSATVCVDCAELDPGAYEWNLVITSNDYLNPEIVVPVYVYYEPTGIEDTEPARLALRGNYPNPFGPGTTIAYELPAAARVDLRIYDVAGRLVRTLVDGSTVGAGRHAVPWDGRNDDGEQLASGVYLYRLEVGGEIMTKRMVLMR